VVGLEADEEAERAGCHLGVQLGAFVDGGE